MAINKNRVISGTQDAKKNVTVVKTQSGSIEKIRCPKCKQLANPQANGKGGSHLKCSGCGLTFTMQTM